MFLVYFLALLGCQSAKKNTQTIDTHSPEYKAYMAQQHRFAFNNCELTYNEKSFQLGMSLKEIEQLFGSDYERTYDDLIEYWNETLYVWIDNQNNLKGIRVYLNKELINYLLFDDIIIKNTEKMQDFVSRSSKYSFKDFDIDTEGYGYDDVHCSYFFYSSVSYERIGNGHLYMRGDWKLNETNPIEAITIAKRE